MSSSRSSEHGGHYKAVPTEERDAAEIKKALANSATDTSTISGGECRLLFDGRFVRLYGRSG